MSGGAGIGQSRGEHSNVCGVTVADNLCVGCGVCASTCPASCLSIQFNEYGEYAPVQSDGCTECGLCLKVCPFADGNKNEDEIGGELYGKVPGIGHRTECGYYLKAYVGHSAVDGHRARGASGGLATWLLETLLSRGLVDKVIAARSNPDPERLFEFVVVDSADKLRECSGSAYYPLEMSGVLQYVMANDARYAVSGLPCFIKGVRLAALNNRLLRERLVFHAGLVCGQLPSKFFAEYITKLAGGDPRTTKHVSFRGKEPGLSAREPVFTCREAPDSLEPDGRISWCQAPCSAWGRWFFVLNACNYCDDAFAELADVVFMDAWLPEYEHDPRGANLAIARTELAAELLAAGAKNAELVIHELPIERLVDSQHPVIEAKREDLSLRLRASRDRGQRVPRKRVHPAERWTVRDMLSQRLSYHFQASCRRAWARTRGQELAAFYREMPIYRAQVAYEKLTALRNRVLGGIKRRGRRVATRLVERIWSID